MMTLKPRDRIMGSIGSLLDSVEDLEARLERQEKRGKVDETDKAFLQKHFVDKTFLHDLNRILPTLREFYYDWEERY